MIHKCNECEYPDLCLVMLKTAEDYIAPDGELRQIIGCNDEDKYLHGEKLTKQDIDEIGKKLGSGVPIG